MQRRYKYTETVDPDTYRDPQRDLRVHRIWECKFNKVHFQKDDNPYGYWTIHLDKGKPPKGIQGFFTDFESAEIAAMTHYILPKNEEIRNKVY